MDYDSDVTLLNHKTTEENIGNIFLDKSYRDGFGRKKAKTNKQDYIKLESFCTVKETILKMKRHTSEWEMIFVY